MTSSLPGCMIYNCFLQVALLDYGQVKQLPDDLRLGYAKLVLALADTDIPKASQSFKYNTVSVTHPQC